MNDYKYSGTDYDFLLGTYVEIARSDDEFNIGLQALVLKVNGDALRVDVENGEVFWTDVDSVYHDPIPKEVK